MDEIVEARPVIPRTQVQPHDVHASVIGRPLASKKERLFAIAIDLVLIGLLVALVGKPTYLIAAALAFGVFRGLSRWVAAWPVRAALAIGVFAVPVVLSHAMPGRRPSKREVDVSALEDLGMDSADAAALLDGKDPKAGKALADAIGRKVQAQLDEDDQAELREALSKAQISLPPEARAAMLSALAPATASGQTVAKPSSEVEALRAENARLKSDRELLRKEREQLKDKLKKAQEAHGIKDFVLASIDDLGLSLGWSGLYFIAFLVLWKGQTPGKRIIGIRVVRLDGKPIGWWCALERFQGYVSGGISGLLGFAQVLWGHNMQGQHDKQADTVVVRA